MRTIHNSVLTFVLLTLLALPGIAGAAEGGDDSVANVMISEKQIEWLPHVPYDQLVLTVSGPGDAYFSETFPAGTNPVFDLFDNDGVLFPDGSCTYELGVISKVTSEGIDVSPGDRGLSDGGVPEEQEALVQSGYFTIRKGYLAAEGVAETDETEVDPAFPEDPPALTRDICHNDDLIVDGSIGVGFDSVCNQNFGFDTIILKENNLRILFDDTSNSASFPNNDWRLTANDSSNGGGEYFSIDDASAGRQVFKVMAGARANALVVDAQGDVGIGTSTPATDIEIKIGDTPTLRLQQDGTSGFTPQTWDVAGNETNFFIRDVTNGSQLPFRVQPGTPSNALTARADGNVGIGTWAPEGNLHVKGASGDPSSILLETFGGTEPVQWKLNANANTARFTLGPVGGNTPLKFEDSAAENLLRIGFPTATDAVDIGGDLNVTGDLNVSGTKNFKTPNPEDPTQDIYFAALEGPEAGTYFRGSTKTINGEAMIELPPYFTNITEEEGLTVQLTSLGGWHQLYVAEKSPRRLVVRAADGMDGAEFDFLIQGVRKGYADFKVIRDTVPE